MNKVLLVLCLLGISHPACGGTPAAEMANANNRFCLELYGGVQHQPGNLALSPYSISSALAMTYAGARGKMEQEMAHVLHLPFGQKNAHEASAALRMSLLDAAAASGCTLSVANRLWSQEGRQFLQPFLDLTRKHYDAELQVVDFSHQPEDSRRQINTWTGEQTHGMIPDLLQPGSITSLTKLVLTNAIYLKARWLDPFDTNDTHDGRFHTTRAETVKVLMMHRTFRYPYAQTGGAKVLIMNCAGRRSAMVVVLPDSIDGLAGVESDLRSGRLVAGIDAAEETEIIVSLPRFRVESSFSLAPTLASLGMSSAFREDADFSGMDGTRDLFISDVVHKTVVDVTEKGMEAAAATAPVFTWGEHEVPPHPAFFTADHPFLFLIRDTKTGAILFIGRVMNPKG